MKLNGNWSSKGISRSKAWRIITAWVWVISPVIWLCDGYGARLLPGPLPAWKCYVTFGQTALSSPLSFGLFNSHCGCFKSLPLESHKPLNHTHKPYSHQCCKIRSYSEEFLLYLATLSLLFDYFLNIEYGCGLMFIS